MDVRITDNEKTRCALENMLTAALGDHGYYLQHVDVSVALLVIEIAKRAEDKEEWFPLGKWATIQEMQRRVEKELEQLFK